MIIYKFDEVGGFIAGDTESGLTAYAYPSSTYATKAKKSPRADKIACEMMAMERKSDVDAIYRRQEQDARNWRDMGRDPACS